MAYIYENDVGRLGGNLQKTVGYLLSLHKAEYEWNLLGIKVIGHVDALPIPDGTYEYGDAYTVGTAAPYDMWIYTRADEFHSEAYWFNIGKFPAPGPQGPKGDGLEQITTLADGNIKSFAYYGEQGAEITSDASVSYKDSTTGEDKTQHFTMISNLPIIPGKYISMDATSDNKKMEVKVDDTALGLDFFKISKDNANTIPAWDGTSVWYMRYTGGNVPYTIVSRYGQGDADFHRINTEYIGFAEGGDSIDFYTLFTNTQGSDYTIDKTPTDTGTLTATQIAVLTAQYQAKNLRIIYDNQVYIRMDPLNHQDDTMRYIHIESIEDGNGGYKATGKCFSVTVSTREWKVFDLDFVGSTRTTHNLTLTYSSTGTNIYFSLTNNRTETYEGAPAGLLAALENSQIACTVDANGTYSAGMITTDGTNFQVTYGNGEQLLIEQMLVSITDNMV